MKLAAKSLLLLVTLAATFANATQHFQHIIIIVQENRTVDNLFGASTESGINISPTGKFFLPNVGEVYPALGPIGLNGDYDPDHSNASFVQMYHAGNMDGDPTGVKCSNDHDADCCAGAPYCFKNNQWDYLWIKYVDNSSQQVQPYFDIANAYGFANYFFQTNEGPSFPAHQFLFGATSAPSASSALFAAENPPYPYGDNTGCAGGTGQTVALINYAGQENSSEFPCYEHQTLSDLFEGQGMGWRYYADSVSYLWTAPNAILHICLPPGVTENQCQNTDFISHVANYVGPGTILTDLGVPDKNNQMHCDLQPVSWVVPDGAWSDHPNPVGDGPEGLLGPTWVASIINAVGGYDNSGNQLQKQCKNLDGSSYWDTTAIFVLWDDWGGWYDHVLPSKVIINQQGVWGSGYVYGLRVPLLVVSAYTPRGYVSDPWTSGPPPTACPPTTGDCMDFGSILQFVESNWGLTNIGGTQYQYADFYAKPLNSNFFSAAKRSFQPFTTGLLEPQSYFVTYTKAPQDPDNDAQ